MVIQLESSSNLLVFADSRRKGEATDGLPAKLCNACLIPKDIKVELRKKFSCDCKGHRDTMIC